MERLSSKFRHTLKKAGEGQIVVPRLLTILYDPDFKTFTVEVPGMDKRREPDGWFHPSTHPSWTERQLYYYLTEPESIRVDPFEYEGALAVSAGSFFHDVVQHVCLEFGMLTRFSNCPCGVKHNEAEWLLVDEEVGSRGHGDGEYATGDGMEFKTAHPSIVDGFIKTPFAERVERLKEKKPAYYLQAQEYLRMSGRDRMLMVFIATSYPFSLAEVHVPFDRVVAHGIRERYLRVRQAVADKRTPYECCGGVKSCPVLDVCSGVV